MLSPGESLWHLALGHLALGHLALGTWWVLDHPARATLWVRAATTFMLPKEEDTQVYTYHREGRTWGRMLGAPGVIPSLVLSHPGCCPERRRDAACLAFIFSPITLFRTFITIHAVTEELALVLH